MSVAGRWRCRRRAGLASAVGAVTLIFTALAASGARGASSPLVVHGSGNLTGSVLECSTDTVTLSGAYRFTETGFLNQLPNGTWFSHGSLSFALEGVTGVGASGTSYRVVGATHLGYGFVFGPASSGRDVEDSTETWTLVPNGGGRPLSFREHFVFVVTPSGSTTLVDHGSSDCS